MYSLVTIASCVGGGESNIFMLTMNGGFTKKNDFHGDVKLTAINLAGDIANQHKKLSSHNPKNLDISGRNPKHRCSSWKSCNPKIRRIDGLFIPSVNVTGFWLNVVQTDLRI